MPSGPNNPSVCWCHMDLWGLGPDQWGRGVDWLTLAGYCLIQLSGHSADHREIMIRALVGLDMC